MKIKWSQIDGVCRAVQSLAGADTHCWLEQAGDVVAGEKPPRLFTPCKQRVGGTNTAEIIAYISGRDGHRWIDLFGTVVRADLEQQGTIRDMAAATARAWRQMNALLAMAAGGSLGLETGKTIQRIFDHLTRATRFGGGIAIVRLPGSDDCIQLDASGVCRVPEDVIAGLEGIGDQVCTFTESGPDDPVLRACSAILDPYRPVAAARLQTENDKFGWLLAAASDEVSSDDLKLFVAAARIIAVALENSHTLSLERAAARVELERELYQSMVKTAPVGLFRADATGRVLYVSDRWCEVTGITEADALRDGWLAAVHDDDLTRVTTEWEEMLVEGTPVRCEHRCRRDDYDVWVLTEVARETQEEGGFVGTMTDISDRKLAESVRAELESQLRHAQKMEAVGTMAGGIAHDFNNLLGAIVGNAELAVDRLPDGDRGRVHIDRLMKGAMRARELVRQMLAFSRQTEKVRVPQDIAPILEEALELIRVSVPSTIDLRTRVEPSGCLVAADATQIHQVLVNLCTNAYQAIGDTTGEIEVLLASIHLDDAAARRLSASAHAAEYVRMSVIDSGPGISTESKERIFDPFFTTKTERGGSGMGLAVVHGIVADHGGFVVVDNEPGRGARFDVYFPEVGSAPQTATAIAQHERRLTATTPARMAATTTARIAITAPNANGASAAVNDGELPDGESLENLVAAFMADEQAKPPARVFRDPRLPEVLSENDDGSNGSAEPGAAGLLHSTGTALALAGRRGGVVAARRRPHTVARPALPPAGGVSKSSPAEDSLLERLVAEFVAQESTAATPAGDGDGRRDGASIETPAPGASSTDNLPALRPAGVPARARLIERAPAFRRGQARLLGADRARRGFGELAAPNAHAPRALPAAATASDGDGSTSNGAGAACAPDAAHNGIPCCETSLDSGLASPAVDSGPTLPEFPPVC